MIRSGKPTVVFSHQSLTDTQLGIRNHEEFQAALDRIVTACHENHKFCIIYAGVIENAAASFKRGYDSVAYNVDTAILIEAYRDRVAQLRSMI